MYGRVLREASGAVTGIVEHRDATAPWRALREGAGLGVARQEADCRERAERLGWTTGGLYVDNDLSAYSGKIRPEYSRMLEDLRSGVINAVIAWHPDRLHRSPRELEEFIDICEGAGVTVETVKAGPVDADTFRVSATRLRAARKKLRHSSSPLIQSGAS